jgi:hypothetical protein
MPDNLKRPCAKVLRPDSTEIERARKEAEAATKRMRELLKQPIYPDL